MTNEPDTRELDFAFGIKSHPICKKCVSSLHQDDPCYKCNGDGWVERDGNYDDDEIQSGAATCPECFGYPALFRCPTCGDSWSLEELRTAGMTDDEEPTP